MQIKELEKKYGDFYVPTFVIKVGGRDLVRDLYLAVSTVSVDLKEKSAGRFSFTVASSFDWDKREFLARRGEERIDLLELFAFGSPVEVSLGYGDAGQVSQNPLLTGLVTEISTDFASGSTPELTISGFDDLYPLTIGKTTRHWEQSRDSDAVGDVAGRRGLSTDVQRTNPVKSRIDQNNETDLVFVEKLAERNSATFYMRDRRFYFGPRQNSSSDVVNLEWGQGLVSFSPEANLARQISEVQVHGWVATEGKTVVGKARKGDETGKDRGTKTGSERITTALSETPILSVRAAVHSQAEADERARAILEERAQDFVTGSGESIGVPEILPDRNITLGGMGRGFNKTYYLSAATHTLDGGGYRTSFKVQEPGA